MQHTVLISRVTMVTTFLLLWLLLPASSILASSTWYVDSALGTDLPGQGTAPGTDAFLTISYAIASATPGDTINVAPGTYNENVMINKAGLQLIGAKAGIPACPFGTVERGDGESIINGTVTIKSSDITIDGFEIHSGTANGFYIQAVSPVIQNNVFLGVVAGSGQQSGIQSQVTSDASILHNSVSNYRYGFNLDGGPANSQSILQGNCISDTLVAGILLQGSLSNGHTILANTIEDNSGSGIVLAQGEHWVTDNIIRNNGGTGIFIYGTPRTHDLVINSNIISGNSYGIYNYDSTDGQAINTTARWNTIICNRNLGIYTASLLDAVENWWGCNDGPGGAAPGSGDEISVNVSFGPWIVASLNANPASIPADGISTSTITIDMTTNSSGLLAGDFIPDGTEVFLYTTDGTINSPVFTADGQATAIFTAGTEVTTVDISANISGCYECDNGSITMELITPPESSDPIVGIHIEPQDKSYWLLPVAGILALAILSALLWFAVHWTLAGKHIP